VTPAEFRRLALSLPDAEEREHMRHPDFRVGGKIFATLNYPDKTFGMARLFPDQQAAFVAADPDMFTPVKGAWGKQGATLVRLNVASKERVCEALALAWERAAPKGLAAGEPAERSTSAKTKKRPAKKGRAKI
jgi:hypothetical protein